MRPPTFQQISDLETLLPMGCCCSTNTKVHPDIEKRREEQRKLRVSLYAPSALAVENISGHTSSKLVRTFSFGESLSKKPGPSLKDSSSSSREDQQSEDNQLNNRLRKSLRGGRGFSSKVPKTKGFAFPVFPSVHGLGPDPLYANQKKQASNNIRREKGGGGKLVSALRKRPNDHLLYKRIEKAGSSSNENFHTGSDSDMEGELSTPQHALGRKRTLEKKIISVHRKNGSEEFYEQTYSKSNANVRPLPGAKLSVTFKDKEAAVKHKSKQATKNAKAQEQRLLCSYLSQPKSRISPIIRASSSSKQNLESPSSRKNSRRRILKKSWLMSSQRNLPLLGIDSRKNLRFDPEVKVVSSRLTSNNNSIPPSKTKVGSRNSHHEEYFIRLDSNKNRKSMDNSSSVKTRRLPVPEEFNDRPTRRTYHDYDEDDNSEGLGAVDEARKLDSRSRSSSRSRRRQAFTNNYVNHLLIKDTYYN